MNWPQAVGSVAQPVPAMNRDGMSLDSDLADGEEVEILSWQPRSRGGLLYEIRRVGDGREWWIAAAHLRRTNETSPIQLQPAVEATGR